MLKNIIDSLLGESESYQKILVLGGVRSGTNLLMSLLNSHPKIVVHGEKFNIIGKRELPERLDDPVGHLKRTVYKPYPSRIKAVGFKIFYTHCHRAEPGELEPFLKKHAGSDFIERANAMNEYLRSNFDLDEVAKRLEGVWGFLKDMPDLKIIHIVRRNKMERLVSLVHAFKYDVWHHGPREMAAAREAIHISYDECVSYFKEWERETEKYDAFFSDKDKITVFYEDLCGCRDGTMKDVLEFIDVERRRLKTPLVKQNKQPLQEVVSNYSELAERFRGTEWEECFFRG